MVEHCPLYTGSVAFYHYCADCWVAPAANGGPSAAERTGVELTTEDDLRRLWLAECRAHGETRRKLAAAEARHDEVKALIEELRRAVNR